MYSFLILFKFMALYSYFSILHLPRKRVQGYRAAATFCVFVVAYI